MPVYEYRCETCGVEFERLFLSLKQIPAEISCPTCQGTEVQRLLSAPALLRAGKGATVEVEDTTPAKPPVFGRKELNQALENKKKLRESALHGE
ncbi:MAG: zinc ribbon domain-containing protein [Anaerolineae bacterium]